MQGRRYFASLALLVSLVACGGGDDGAAATAAARLTGGMEAQRAGVENFSKLAATAATTPAAAAAATAATAGQAAAPAPLPKIGGVNVSQDQVRQIAQTALAQALNVPVGQVAIDRVEQVEWNDSSIGCPQPGMMYAQVITPGFRVVATVNGQRKQVHTDMSGRAVVCDNPTQ
jgi:hypothetical protein